MNRETFDEDYEFDVTLDEKGCYEVSLPHQCDEWKILGWEDEHQSDKKIAVKQMELFVKRAQEALEKLKQLP